MPQDANNDELALLKQRLAIGQIYHIWNEALCDTWFPTANAPASIGSTGKLYDAIIALRRALGDRLSRERSVESVLDLLGIQWQALRAHGDIDAVRVIERLGEALMEAARNKF